MLHLRLQLLQLAFPSEHQVSGISYQLKGVHKWGIMQATITTQTCKSQYQLTWISSNHSPCIWNFFKHKTPFFQDLPKDVSLHTHERKVTNIFFKSFTLITVFFLTLMISLVHKSRIKIKEKKYTNDR